MIQGRRYDVIVRALQAARQARDAELRREFEGGSDAQTFARLLDHPYLLPLAEFVENECTTLAGARILLENLLAREEEVILAVLPFPETRLETLATTGSSQGELDACLSALCSEAQAAAFMSAVRRYLCIDNGYGIVPQRALLERELRRGNYQFLKRVVAVSDGRSPFAPQYLNDLERSAFVRSVVVLPTSFPDKEIIDLTDVAQV